MQVMKDKIVPVFVTVCLVTAVIVTAIAFNEKDSSTVQSYGWSVTD